jgi:hypothetical protein
MSGIVVDNQLSNGGTNIYFSTLAPGSVNGQKMQRDRRTGKSILRGETDAGGIAITARVAMRPGFCSSARA